MLDLQTSTPTHAGLFIERYEKLRVCALRLTERNHERAEDLLHDAFIQFTLSHPDLNSIHDLDSYLFVSLRNLHLSQMRRATRVSARELSIVDYDSAELGLWAIDPRDQIKTQDELRTVCHYACMRKKTAKAGSVLILRFFHGYYPEEVAAVLRITRAAVKDRLRLARAEAILFLSGSDRLNLISEDRRAERPRAEIGRVADDLLGELRETIFASREGACFALKQLQEFYSDNEDRALECEVVAHLVSCAKCLDDVNRLLGLPLLNERYASDMTGKDTRKKGGPGGGGSSGGGGVKASLNRYLRRAQQVYRHEPQELCIAVNGYLQATQKISSDENEFSLIVDMTEQIGFVEVFSELGVRLLLLNVDPLPVGAVRQETRVELSEGRTLDASLSFSGAWPTVNVAYREPVLSEPRPVGVANDSVLSPAAMTGPAIESEPSPPLTPRIADYLRRLWSTQFWLKPGTITAALAILLTSAFILWRKNPSQPLTAGDLLQRAAYSEEVALSRPDTVIHRTLQVEQKREGDSQVLARQKVEIWQSPTKGLTARRLYNDQGQLLAGEWTRSDNVSTIYHHGVRPQIQLRNEQSAVHSFDDVWLIDLTAKDFTTLVGAAKGGSDGGQLNQTAQVQETADTYLITYSPSKEVRVGSTQPTEVRTGSDSDRLAPIYKGQPA